jgi:hypothetical protein
LKSAKTIASFAKGLREKKERRQMARMGVFEATVYLENEYN